MAGPPHPFLPNLNNQQAMRNQFAGTLQNQMGNTMQNQLNNPMQIQMGPQIPTSMMSPMGPTMAGQMGSQMNSQINSNMSNQMNTMNNSNQIMNQMNSQYAMNNANQIPQQNSNAMQIQQQQALGIQHNSLPQQNQAQTIQTPSTATPTTMPPVQPQSQQSKEFNTASLCRIGQETVQDIVSRTQEVFQTLKIIQPPNGTPQGANTSNEKKVKVQEQLRTIRVLFKRLRLIYEKCNENCQTQGMEYTHIESLIPYKDEIEPKHDEKKSTEAYRSTCEESKEIMEQVVLKNKQLKEVIDHLRRIIWEINTMLTMRRS